MLTKKDFEAIAEIIREADKANEIRYVGSVAHRFVDYFKIVNPHFDRNKFLAACGL